MSKKLDFFKNILTNTQYDRHFFSFVDCVVYCAHVCLFLFVLMELYCSSKTLTHWYLKWTLIECSLGGRYITWNDA